MPAFPQKKGDILIYPSLKNHQLLRPMPKQPAVFFQGLSKQHRNLVIVQFPVLIGLQVHEVFGASENFWGVFAASPENCQPHCAEEKNQQNRTLRFCTEICALGWDPCSLTTVGGFQPSRRMNHPKCCKKQQLWLPEQLKAAVKPNRESALLQSIMACLKPPASMHWHFMLDFLAS